MSKNLNCKDCGKPITCQAERCEECAYKQMRIDHPLMGNYKNGKYCKKYFCIDCGKELHKVGAKRCKECYKIVLSKRLKEKPNRKGQKASLETRVKLSLSHGGDGSLNPLNQGYAEDFDSELKRKIFERDNFKCQHPDCDGNCRLLIVHHIDYNKNNSDDMNLITFP